MLTVAPDFTWTLCIGRRKVDIEQCQVLRGAPIKLCSVDAVMNVISTLEASKYCEGNPDSKFAELVSRHNGTFKDQSGTKTIAHHDSQYFPSPTIRHTDCECIISSVNTKRCQQCDYYRYSLHSLLSRENRRSLSGATNTPSVTTNYRYLTKPEIVGRLHDLQHQNRLAKLRIDRLKEKLSTVIANQSVVLDEDTSKDMEEIMQEEEEQVTKNFCEGSFQQIFWQQQKEAASKSDKRGLRWHPLIIKWCLYLRHQSGKAYETLRDSGVLQLPSQRTLRDYSNCVKARAGYSVEVDCQLIQAAHLTTCEEWQKLVILLLDEMYIREDLVYDKHTGKMVWFCNLGDVNNHLLSFERSLEESDADSPVLAKTMMVFMVRGLFTPLRLLAVMYYMP